MSKSPIRLAKELLDGDAAKIELLRMHDFLNDLEAHDDELTERLYQVFSTALEHVRSDLDLNYGLPTQVGTDERPPFIPLNGVFRFAVWDVGNRQLFLAAAHEDRGVPILLILGTTAVLRSH